MDVLKYTNMVTTCECLIGRAVPIPSATKIFPEQTADTN